VALCAPVRWLLILVTVIATAEVSRARGAVPPGRQRVLTIDGENTVMFAPRIGLAGTKLNYKARIEYIVKQ
jgi:hypothetical protein